MDQLGEGGRLIIPVGNSEQQRLVRARRENDKIHYDDLGDAKFVPLLGGVR